MQVSHLTQIAYSPILKGEAVTHLRTASPRSHAGEALTRSATDSKTISGRVDSYEGGDRIRALVKHLAAFDPRSLTEMVRDTETDAPKTGGEARAQALTYLASSVPTGTESQSLVEAASHKLAESVTELVQGGSGDDSIAAAASFDEEATTLTNRGSSISRIRHLVNDLRRSFTAETVLAHRESKPEGPARIGITVQQQLIAHLESLVRQSPIEPTEVNTFLDDSADQQQRAIDAFVAADTLTESGTSATSID